MANPKVCRQRLRRLLSDPFDEKTIGYTGFVYAFPDIAFEPGAIKSRRHQEWKIVAQDEIKTAGAPASLKLTVHTGPNGLQALMAADVDLGGCRSRGCPR